MENNQEATEQEKYEQRYKRGYNLGYLLAEMAPETARDFAEINAKNPLLEGIKAGKETFDREQKEKETKFLPDWLKSDRLKNAFNERGIDHDKSRDIERER